MNRFLQYLFLFFLTNYTTAYAKGQDSIAKWEVSFIEEYKETLQHQDIERYKSLVISQQELDSIFLHLETKQPNCISESEKQLNAEKLAGQFFQLKDYGSDIKDLVILNTYPINGCGGIEGFKLNIQFDFKDMTKRYRTLTFLKIRENTCKLLFDLESGNN